MCNSNSQLSNQAKVADSKINNSGTQKSNGPHMYPFSTRGWPNHVNMKQALYYY